MSVSLKKGECVNLKKDAPNLSRVLIGLGWDPIRKFLGPNMDIDASVICMGPNDEYESVVYYGNLLQWDGAIRHCGDNLTGDGDGDDEQIVLSLEDIPKKVQKLSIIINIFSAYSRHQDFGKVKNCFVHVTDRDTNKELVRYDIDDSDGNYDKCTGIFVADIYRHDGEWEFRAIGEGVKVKDINDMIHIKCQ